jgi:hypothetical protein
MQWWNCRAKYINSEETKILEIAAPVMVPPNNGFKGNCLHNSLQ